MKVVKKNHNDGKVSVGEASRGTDSRQLDVWWNRPHQKALSERRSYS